MTGAPPERSAFRAIASGGLVAGTFDIGFAILFYGYARGSDAVRVLQSVASGWLGKAAFDGGAGAVVLGLVTHFAIATGAAAVFYGASRVLPALVHKPVAGGIVFGIGLFAFMNLVVIPLSAAPFRPSFAPASALPGVAVHMFLIGLPIALCARRFGPDPEPV